MWVVVSWLAPYIVDMGEDPLAENNVHRQGLGLLMTQLVGPNSNIEWSNHSPLLNGYRGSFFYMREWDGDCDIPVHAFPTNNGYPLEPN